MELFFTETNSCKLLKWKEIKVMGRAMFLGLLANFKNILEVIGRIKLLKRRRISQDLFHPIKMLLMTLKLLLIWTLKDFRLNKLTFRDKLLRKLTNICIKVTLNLLSKLSLRISWRSLRKSKISLKIKQLIRKSSRLKSSQ